MKFTKAFLITALIFAGQRSQAVDLGFFGNLNAGNAVSNTTSVTVGGATDQMYAQGFTMGASWGYTMDKFYLAEGGEANGGTARVAIYSDNAGVPGTDLTGNIWDGSAAPISPGAQFMPLGTPVSLAANTRYWLVVSEANSGAAGASFGWYDSDPGILPDDAFSFAPVSPFGPTGTTYFGTKTKTSSTGWANSSDNFLGFRLGGTAVAVPEPSTYAMGVIASGVLAWAARRRKRANG